VLLGAIYASLPEVGYTIAIEYGFYLFFALARGRAAPIPFYASPAILLAFSTIIRNFLSLTLDLAFYNGSRPGA
jgi:hypothetical protein